MSQMMDTENTEEDRVSLKSNGKTPTNGGAKESLGMLKTLRKSIRRAAEKSPLTSGGKGLKVTTGNESGSLTPQSPSRSSPVTSPLGNIGGLFNKKDEEGSDTTPQKGKELAHSKTDPNMSRFDSILTRGESIRRSLNLVTKKDKACRQQPLVSVAEGPAEEKTEEKAKEEEYTLPEIPHTPLSVMQINNLIELVELQDAHLNLLALRQEFQQERERSGDDSPVELAKKEKDLNLLYGELRNKIKTIVRDSNSLPSGNKELLEPVVRIIQEEEKRAEQPGGLQDSWREAWREAVGEGVKVKIGSIELEQKENNLSWLAVHLGLLGKTILEDLESVKKDLRWSYPPSFKVFSTYVRSYHSCVGQHLKKLEPQVTEVKDLYALLNWIINGYKSEKIMGGVSLQPEMEEESSDLQLEEDFLKKLKDKYCCKLKEDIRCTLDRVIEQENKTIWRDRKTPEKDEGFLHSQFPMDIWTNLKGLIVCSAAIDAQLKQKVISSCLQELKDFPKRFEAGFRLHCSALQPLWTEYQITYINSFTALQQHMEGYRDTCPAEVEDLKKEINGLIFRLMQGLEVQFKEDVELYLRRMITRKWLTDDEDFKKLSRRTELLSKHCALMRPPHNQDFASRLHYHVVREYIGQLMKKNFSCKNQKHERAASKIRKQWEELRDLFEDMESAHEWLYDVGDELSIIIEQENKRDIKNHLETLVKHYPDFCKKHLVAVLYFRGLIRGREHQLILQKFTELKKTQGRADEDKSHVLFRDMQIPANTDCFSHLPFSCLSSLLPDN
ncbi:exocyst complex component 3-like protein 4 [Gymnodraco acuticeps]|uniref:Exocyst complex component 3-like protein 4 n=1 Tax=Gymnodraco acuticeps TaxID=8218 RepID=A0A6P8VL73_GYMAC|nr:exocyst complex component 3-like protein 4 [Gymnodraco acuticeps]